MYLPELISTKANYHTVCAKDRGHDPWHTYSVFHQFRQAKFDNGGSILSPSQFLLLPQKMKLASKVVKIDSE
jgi:hypothetical protein